MKNEKKNKLEEKKRKEYQDRQEKLLEQGLNPYEVFRLEEVPTAVLCMFLF